MYQLIYLVIIIIASLPKWIKNLLELKLFILIYYVVGYRKKVVYNNLKLAFPNKNSSEISKLRRSFYRHLIDVFMETVQPIAWDKETMNKHFKIQHIEVVKKQLNERSVLLMGGHYANWDWLCSIAAELEEPSYVVYQRIKDKNFERLIHKIRSRFGSILVPNGKVAKTVLLNQRQGVRAAYTMISDQSPQLSRTKLWLPFMGTEVPVHTGAASLAIKAKMAVFYVKTIKTHKNTYETEFVLLSADASTLDERSLTQLYYDQLEAQIKNDPAYYFWTHRRWKHAGKKA